MVRIASSHSEPTKRLRKTSLVAVLLCSGLIAAEVYFLRGPGTLMIFPTMSVIYVLSRYHLRYRALFASLLVAISTFVVVASLLILDETGLHGANTRHALESGAVVATIVLALALACAIALNGKRQGIVIAFGVLLVTMVILSTVKPE
jgi:hypothetical protein